MNSYTNELEQFIYQICYPNIWKEVNKYIAEHPTRLDLQYCRVNFPDTAYVEDMILQFTRNIRTDQNILSFDAIVSCTVHVEETGYREDELNQWLLVSCNAVVEDRLKDFSVKSIINYKPGRQENSANHAASRNIVPILYKKDLEAEAESFLEQYFPDALERPTAVPIEDIAIEMGLDILRGHCITEDLSVFGEICFSSGQIPLYDPFKLSQTMVEIKRGTIIIDANTYWERNVGCVNNTIAHEVYHWYKHRIYAAVKHLLRNEKMIACRCPTDIVYPGENSEWTDEQRMEWQANNMAPRILMPQRTFKMKVDELYALYRYYDSPIKPMVLTCIADDLARFYGVSRQSALIRMIETGYKEAASVYYYSKDSGYHTYISKEDAFHEYSNNAEFRRLVDSGLFRYIDGYFVINDEAYVTIGANGLYELTDYAWANLDHCALKFSWRIVNNNSSDKHLPIEIFHRANNERKISKCEVTNNADVIQMSEELCKKRKAFESQKEIHRINSPSKTCWQMMYQIIQARGISKSHFCSLTGLGEEVYRKAEKNIDSKPNMRTIISFAHGFGLDLDSTEKLLQLAGHAFDESDEHQALKFCITGYAGEPIEDCNEFLQSYGYEPLGTQQRK